MFVFQKHEYRRISLKTRKYLPFTKTNQEKERIYGIITLIKCYALIKNCAMINYD